MRRRMAGYGHGYGRGRRRQSYRNKSGRWAILSHRTDAMGITNSAYLTLTSFLANGAECFNTIRTVKFRDSDLKTGASQTVGKKAEKLLSKQRQMSTTTTTTFFVFRRFGLNCQRNRGDGQIYGTALRHRRLQLHTATGGREEGRKN